MRQIWELFPKICERVEKSHKDVGLVGAHDIVHAVRVVQVAYQLSLDEYGEYTAMLAGLAGLFHNADRIFEKKFGLTRNDEIAEDQIRGLVSGWIGENLSSDEKERIICAVLCHRNKNGENDDAVLICLMDADRVVNLAVDFPIRCGQEFSNLLAVDYGNFLGKNLKESYWHPKSVLGIVSLVLEWADPATNVCVRTRLGKKMAEKRAKIIRDFFANLDNQIEEENMLDYSFPR